MLFLNCNERREAELKERRRAVVLIPIPASFHPFLSPPAFIRSGSRRNPPAIHDHGTMHQFARTASKQLKPPLNATFRNVCV